MWLDKVVDTIIDFPSKLADRLKPDESLEARVNRYADLEGVSTKKLNTGLWYVKKNKLIFLTVVWALVLAAGVMWSYVLYYFGYYLFVGIKQDRQLYADIANPADVVRIDFDANLKVGVAQALAWGDDQYDLIGELVNDNQNAWGFFSYHFLINGRRYGEGRTFVLPNEKKFVTAFNQSIGAVPDQVVLVVENFSWRRVNFHLIPDWSTYRDERLNFVVRDKLFASAVESGLTENVDLNRLTFSIVNQSAFNFRQAPFLVLMYTQDKIVGINRYVVNDFFPRQEKAVSLTVVGHLPKISKVEVVPDINILDDTIFGPLK